MVSLNWCLNSKKGVSLIDSNENLAKEYMNSAEETLSVLKNIKDNSPMWLATKSIIVNIFQYILS